jgi:hypothetical protein
VPPSTLNPAAAPQPLNPTEPQQGSAALNPQLTAAAALLQGGLRALLQPAAAAGDVHLGLGCLGFGSWQCSCGQRLAARELHLVGLGRGLGWVGWGWHQPAGNKVNKSKGSRIYDEGSTLECIADHSAQSAS